MDKCHWRIYYTQNLGGLVTCTLGAASGSEPTSRTRVDRPCELGALKSLENTLSGAGMSLHDYADSSKVFDA
jgi:hypothetical protein